jgi:hypothetical protein
VLNVTDRRDRARRVAVLLTAKNANRPVVKLEDLLAGEWDSTTIGAVQISGGALFVPFAQQPNFQFRLAKQLIPTKHWSKFVVNY